MITELAILRAKNGDEARLRDGLRAARAVIARASGYRDSTFYQGVEDPRRFVLRIEWDNVAAHMEGFRAGPLFAEWRSHFGHYLEGPPDMHHFTAIAGPGGDSSAS